MRHPADEPKRRTRSVVLTFGEVEHDRLRQTAYEHGLRLTDYARHVVRVGAGLIPLAKSDATPR